MMLGKFGYRLCVARAQGTQEVFRLDPELAKTGPDGKSLQGHDEPPCRQPGVRVRRAKRRFVMNRSIERAARWTRSFPRTGGVLGAGPNGTPRAMIPEVGRLRR